MARVSWVWRTVARPSVLPAISPTSGESTRSAVCADPPTGRAPKPQLPISPRVGEMSGRTEGGATERDALKALQPT